MAGLLFLAFAYFAVGQAAAIRSDAQGAADAAALAAVNEAREQIAKDLVDNFDEIDEWEDLIQGLLFPSRPSCDAAASFAKKNDATSDSCVRTALPRQGFTVEVTTDDPVGRSLIPGTSSQKVKASATAVIEPMCTLSSSGNREKGESIGLICQGKDIEVNPDDDEPLPDLDDLFRVRLVR